MSAKFTSQKLLSGLFEPEGVYLAQPIEGDLIVLQNWGANPRHYAQWNYNGVPLKGHTGIDLRAQADTVIHAVDAGRIVEIAQEKGGYERYIKIEHRWGESFYAYLGNVLVETGQSVNRGEAIAHTPADAPIIKPYKAGVNATPPASAARNSAARNSSPSVTWFHFGVRIAPFNRYDGYGGFSDPIPFLPDGSVALPSDSGDDLRAGFTPHPMAEDRPGLRRP